MLENDKWELYNADEDFSLTNDLASSNPTKLKEMQNLFLEEATKNHVLPIDDRGVERLNPSLAGRPDLMAGRRSLTVYSGMTGMMESAFINIKNRSFAVAGSSPIQLFAVPWNLVRRTWFTDIALSLHCYGQENSLMTI